MLELIKKMFFVTMTFFSCNTLHLNPLNAVLSKFVPMSNQEYKIRPEMINIDSDEPWFYPYSI